MMTLVVKLELIVDPWLDGLICFCVENLLYYISFNACSRKEVQVKSILYNKKLLSYQTTITTQRHKFLEDVDINLCTILIC